MLLHEDGTSENLNNFVSDQLETQVFWSCSVQWQNQMMVFGGVGVKRQISEVTDCGLTRVGTLEFDLDSGACTVDNQDRIYLCFNDKRGDLRSCRRGVEPTGDFDLLPFSMFEHRFIRIAASNGEKS